MTSTEILIFVVIGYVGNKRSTQDWWIIFFGAEKSSASECGKDQKGDGYLNEDGGYTSRVYRRTRCRCGAGVDIQILLH